MGKGKAKADVATVAPAEPDLRDREAAEELAARAGRVLDDAKAAADLGAKLADATAPADAAPPPPPGPTPEQIEAATRDVAAISRAVDTAIALGLMRGHPRDEIESLLDECDEDGADDGRRLGPRLAGPGVALPIVAFIASKVGRVCAWLLKRSAKVAEVAP